MNMVSVHRTVTCSAVSVDIHNKNKLVPELFEVSIDKSESILLFKSLSSLLSIRLSFSDTKLSKVLSMLLTSLELILSVILFKSLLIQDNVFIMSLMRPSRSLFFFEVYSLDNGSLPRSDIRSSTLFLNTFDFVNGICFE